MSANDCLCCAKSKVLGCFPSCTDIDTTLDAAMDGDYTLQIPFNGQIFTKTVALTTGDDIVIPGDCVNSPYNYKAVKVYDPNGEIVKTPLPDEEECFEFDVVPKVVS